MWVLYHFWLAFLLGRVLFTSGLILAWIYFPRRISESEWLIAVFKTVQLQSLLCCNGTNSRSNNKDNNNRKSNIMTKQQKQGVATKTRQQRWQSPKMSYFLARTKWLNEKKKKNEDSIKLALRYVPSLFLDCGNVINLLLPPPLCYSHTQHRLRSLAVSIP